MNRLKSTMKITYALKRTRSANAPVIRAGVMMANFSWNSAKSISGMVGARSGWVSPPTPLNMKKVRGSPISPWMLSPKLRLNPTTTHSRLMTAMAMKLCISVDTTFFSRTMPP